MKKLFLLLLIIVLSSIFVSAQNSENWQTFASGDEQFSAEVPGALNREQNSDDLSYSRYSLASGSIYLFIFSDTLKDLKYYKQIEELMFLKLKPRFPIKIGQFSAEKYEFDENKNFYHTIVRVKTKNRNYVFHTVSPTENNPTVKRFFDSIKFDEKVLSEERVEKDKKETGIGTGIGIGLGGGNSSDTGNVNSVGSGIKSNETRALKIISKPKPNYPTAAKFYGIDGTIRLRVTFSANGQIGAVTPLTRLPFGLTTEAISAAAEIKFEPAVKDGVPFAVTKIVEYTFTIY